MPSPGGWSSPSVSQSPRGGMIDREGSAVLGWILDSFPSGVLSAQRVSRSVLERNVVKACWGLREEGDPFFLEESTG